MPELCRQRDCMKPVPAERTDHCCSDMCADKYQAQQASLRRAAVYGAMCGDVGHFPHGLEDAKAAIAEFNKERRKTVV